MRQSERRLWWSYYRPYMRAVLLFIACTIVGSSFLVAIERRQQDEWGAAAIQQGEGTCVQAQLLVPKSGIGFRAIYRIDGVERTGLWEQDACLAGKRYALRYQIGRTGQLRFLDRSLL